MPPATLTTSFRPERIRKPATAADRPPMWQTTMQRPLRREAVDPVMNVDVGMSTAPGARTSSNSLISRTSSRIGPAGSSRSRRSASATSIVGIGRAGSSGAPSQDRWCEVRTVGMGGEIRQAEIDRLDEGVDVEPRDD